MSSDEARRLAEMFASRADHASVTTDRLAGSAEAVADLESPPVARLADGEKPKFCFESHEEGVGVGDPDDTVSPERGGVFLFTDRRVCLLLGVEGGDEARSLPYESIPAADWYAEMTSYRIELRTEATSYHLWIPAAFDREDVVEAVEYATYRHKRATPDSGGERGEESGPQSVHERLERLGDAKSRGLIDEEEFQHRKEKLLDEDSEGQ